MDSSAEVYDTGSEYISMQPFAEGISDDDMGLGQTAKESMDFLQTSFDHWQLKKK